MEDVQSMDGFKNKGGRRNQAALIYLLKGNEAALNGKTARTNEHTLTEQGETASSYGDGIPYGWASIEYDPPIHDSDDFALVIS